MRQIANLLILYGFIGSNPILSASFNFIMNKILKGGSIVKTIKTVISFVFILIIWNVVAAQVNPIFIPEPTNVFEAFIEVIKSGQLFKALQYSFLRITIATFISALIAIPVGILIYNVRILYDFIYPVISAMRYIPVTAFYPLLIMWFGIDEVMKIAFLFIATFVYMMPSVMLALDEVNQDLIDTGLTIGMNKLQTITKIQIPATLPSLMNSFIMMYGIGWTYIAVAETVNAKYGLGFIIQQSSSRGRTDLVFMSIITIIIVSVIFDNVSKLLVKKAFKWRYINDCSE